MPDHTLPLFPLNTVLFPRTPLPLRIFEDRYKVMIRRCLESGQEFGVLLIRDGEETGPPAVPVGVGTLARIRMVEEIGGGRLNLLTEGADRFRLLDYATGIEPYLVGMTEPLIDDPIDAESIREAADDIRTLFRDYFSILVAAAGQDLPDYELPENPVDLSFVIAAMLRLGNRERQALLETTDTQMRLAQVAARLRDEVDRVRSASPPTGQQVARLTREWRKPFESMN